MIGFVCGVKGSGKTKKMVDMANGIVNDALGKVVFVDDDNKIKQISTYEKHGQLM